MGSRQQLAPAARNLFLPAMLAGNRTDLLQDLPRGPSFPRDPLDPLLDSIKPPSRQFWINARFGIDTYST